MASLEADPRQGARDLHAILLKRRQAERTETTRVRRMLAIERGWWQEGLQAVAGVDEVGTGPLAGPVVAAAVVFPPGTSFAGVDDSKRLTPEERDAVAPVIRERAAAIGIGMADVDDIDRLNVYHAGVLAMRRAVEALDPQPERVVVDARKIPGLAMPQEAMPKADARVFCVAAASIIAKTYRDALMNDLDAVYPAYGFGKHKGYSTPEHQEAVRLHGPCPVHRASFGYIRQLCGEYSSLFYDLTMRLEDVSGSADVGAVQLEFDACREALTDAERGKLQILLARRRRRFG
jgi:ribonuclease HII